MQLTYGVFLTLVLVDKIRYGPLSVDVSLKAAVELTEQQFLSLIPSLSWEFRATIKKMENSGTRGCRSEDILLQVKVHLP